MLVFTGLLFLENTNKPKKTNIDHSYFPSLHHLSIMIFKKQINNVIPNVILILFEHFFQTTDYDETYNIFLPLLIFKFYSISFLP